MSTELPISSLHGVPVAAARTATEAAAPGTPPVKPVDARAAPGASPEPAESRGPTQEELAEAVRQLNERVERLGRSLRFDIDEDTHKVVIDVVDTETGEVIRQIPGVALLPMILEGMIDVSEGVQGLLLSDRI